MARLLGQGGGTAHGPSRGKRQGAEGGAARASRVGQVEWARERWRGNRFLLFSFFIFSFYVGIDTYFIYIRSYLFILDREQVA